MLGPRRYLGNMKTDRGSFRIGGHQQLLQEVRHDSYKPRHKIPSVSLSGRFFASHRDEIVGRVRRCEQAEKQDHPMQRIMAIAANGAGMRIMTTDAHLARRIGDALYQAFKGELEYRYNKQDNLLRVAWRR